MARSNPHVHVYSRIVCSKIHGVGVRAICKIKKGAPIFEGDKSRLVWIEAKKVQRLPKELRRLYEDFGIKKGRKYGCPRSFNALTPAWYLNHSKHPNVRCDSNYDFYALRNIKAGEELTVDYSTYSE